MTHQLTLASVLLLVAAAVAVFVNPHAALSELTTWTAAVGLATAAAALVVYLVEGDERHPR